MSKGTSYEIGITEMSKGTSHEIGISEMSKDASHEIGHKHTIQNHPIWK
jgi:hypothetical protein